MDWCKILNQKRLYLRLISEEQFKGLSFLIPIPYRFFYIIYIDRHDTMEDQNKKRVEELIITRGDGKSMEQELRTSEDQKEKK